VAEAADFQGTSASPARRWLRRTGALLASAPLLTGLLQLPAATPADAAGQESPQAASGAGSVSVAVDSLSPSTPTEGDTVTVTGTVTNNGKQPVTDAHVDLRVGPSLDTRSSIDALAKKSDDVQGPAGEAVGGKYAEKFSKLTPGVAEPFNISVPVDELDLGQDGVYQLAVALSGETAAQPWDQVLGVQRTFLPWQPEEAGTKTKTTFLWPLVSDVHMTAETGSNEQQTPVFDNDDLAEEISPGGRLEQMVSLGKGLDVTWVIDPDLLASVDAMTKNYQVRDEDGTTTSGRNQAVAKQWLSELQQAVAGKEVVALPFGDPDLASLAHNGTTVTGSLSHLKEATDAIDATVPTILHVKPSTDFAWPVGGAVDPSIMKVATSAGADKVIVHALRGPAHRRRHHGDRRRLQDVHGLPGQPDEGLRVHTRRAALPGPEPDARPPDRQAAQRRRRTAAHALREPGAGDGRGAGGPPGRELVRVAGPHGRRQGQAGPGGQQEGAARLRLPLLAAQAGAAASRLRADRSDAGQARQLQGDPHRPVPGGHPLRSGHEPRDVHVVAWPGRRGGGVPR
jgi:hypothetical protein